MTQSPDPKASDGMPPVKNRRGMYLDSDLVGRNYRSA